MIGDYSVRILFFRKWDGAMVSNKSYHRFESPSVTARPVGEGCSRGGPKRDRGSAIESFSSNHRRRPSVASISESGYPKLPTSMSGEAEVTGSDPSLVHPHGHGHSAVHIFEPHLEFIRTIVHRQEAPANPQVAVGDDPVERSLASPSEDVVTICSS